MTDTVPRVPTASAAEVHTPADTPAADESSLVTVLARRVVPLLILLGCLAALARRAAQPLDNSDTFFHLRFGHEFLTGAWSLRHPGSVTELGTADWTPTQWLPQVVMAWLEEHLGLSAVAWYAGLQYVVLAVVVYLVARRWADPVVASPLTMFVVIACAPSLSMRPQVLSYAFVALTAAAWLAARESGRVPWLLVPLTWCWANYHGMWPVGLSIGLVACLGLRLDGAVRGRALARFLAVPVLSAVAAALTPVGPALYPAVLSVGSRGKYFSEWQPPHATAPNVVALLVVLAVVAVVLARGERSSWTTTLLFVLAAGWTVYSARTVPVAAALAFPIAARALQSLLTTTLRPTRSERVVVWGGAVTTLVVLALVAPQTAGDPAPQPTWVEPTLSALPDGTRVLGDSGYGGYLMWAFPRLDVVMSGYGDIYTDDELERNSAIESGERDWAELVHDTGARYAVVSADSTLGYDLGLQGWTVEHRSKDVQLLAAPADW